MLVFELQISKSSVITVIKKYDYNNIIIIKEINGTMPITHSLVLVERFLMIDHCHCDQRK